MRMTADLSALSVALPISQLKVYLYNQPLHIHLSLNATFLDGSEQRGMIVFGLIRVRLGEEGNRLLKHITLTHVAADLSRYSAARMRSRKSLGTRPGVLIELLQFS